MNVREKQVKYHLKKYKQYKQLAQTPLDELIQLNAVNYDKTFITKDNRNGNEEKIINQFTKIEQAKHWMKVYEMTYNTYRFDFEGKVMKDFFEDKKDIYFISNTHYLSCPTISRYIKKIIEKAIEWDDFYKN